MQKDLLTVEDLTSGDLKKLLALATVMKAKRLTWEQSPLKGKSIGLIFAKSSTRTRVSFEVGIHELGGNALFLDKNDLQLGRGETIEDTAKVLGRYIHGVIIRTYKHSDVVEFAKYAHLPVVNALTDDFHPCQILTDLFTINEFSGKLQGVKIAYVGDCSSNMANSLILAAKLAGLHLTLASPEEYKPDQELMQSGNIEYGSISWSTNVGEVVKDVDYIYTDVWVSMGQEDEKEERLAKFADYQVNLDILQKASPGVKVMHCLPAHRGEEITKEVLELSNSIVFDQAENRLHVQKAILTMLLDENWESFIEE
jgi:ornithine carbamoyltransferase